MTEAVCATGAPEQIIDKLRDQLSETLARIYRARALADTSAMIADYMSGEPEQLKSIDQLSALSEAVRELMDKVLDDIGALNNMSRELEAPPRIPSH